MTRRMLNMNRWKDVPQRLLDRTLHKNLDHETFDSYFEVMKHSKNTRNNNLSLRLPAVKLEVAKQGFSYGEEKLFLKISYDY